MTHDNDTPRIYVACLASYNAGKLHGEWIDADQDVETIRAQIQAILDASPEPIAEDYAIHDYENFGFGLHEHENLEHVAQAAELIAEHGELAQLVIEYFGGLQQLDEAAKLITEQYSGTYENRTAWAWSMLEDSGDLDRVPEHLRPYLDVNRYANDLEQSDYLVLEGRREIYVLWNH